MSLLSLSLSVGGGHSTLTPPLDTTPDAFSFTDVTDATVATSYESNTITVAGLGIDVPAPITITGGEYQKNGGSWTSSAGDVLNGDTVKVRRSSSAVNDQTVDATLSIGGVSDTFSITTGAAAPTAPMTAIATDGWQATVTSPVDLSMLTATVSRQGFDNTGATTSYSDTRTLTKRVRQVYPNNASFTANSQAMDDYVYSTDTIAGVTNNSTEISPKPVAMWSMPDRRVVGNSLTLRAVAFHRNPRGQKAVACVIFRATDGTNTVTSPAAVPTITTEALSGLAIIEYVATLDITSLSAGEVTANAKVYPWIGATASVLDSADQTNAWEFSPRAFTKNTSLAASPNIVYVASGGNDSTGYVGTNDSSAAAAPCATITGAINRARAVLGTSAGALDGLRVRLTAGTWSISTSPTANTTNAEVVIEPATGQTKSTVNFNFGSANANVATTYCRFRDIAIARTGTQALYNKSGGACFVDDCTLDFAANGAQASIGTSGACGLTLTNTTVTNAGSLCLYAGSNQQTRMIRGCVITSASGVSNAGVEERCVLGSKLSGCIGNNNAGRNLSGSVFAFNRCQGGNSGTGMAHFATPDPINGIAVVQNVFEFISSTTAISVGLSNDGAPANTSHVIFWHNTIAGFDGYGRSNVLYDETSGVLRTHKLQSFIANIHCQINTKHDVFAGATGDPLATSRTGGFAYVHGVGCRAEFSRYFAAGTTFVQSYAGVESSLSGTSTSPGVDPLFTDPEHTTSGPVAGAGGGTYTLEAGSPCIGMLTAGVLSHDIAGSTRPSSDDAAGAYAA